MSNLRRIDLNLLVTLEALLTERSVTRAARRLHLSQPSVSVQLRKLRQIFSDPLLSPVSGGMAPTTRAQALLPPLRAVLAEMDHVLNRGSAFDPHTAQVTWQIAASDHSEYAIVAGLIARLRTEAPGARLAVRDASHAAMIKQLEAGAIDLAFLAMEDVPGRVHHRVLYRESYVLIARKGHPALRRKLTLETLCKLEHVVVSPDGGGFRGVTDAVLEGMGHRRRVMFSTQHFLFVPEIVAQSELVALVPSRLVANRARRLQILRPPLSIPSFDMAMIWHERSELDAAHVWLRGQVERALRLR